MALPVANQDWPPKDYRPALDSIRRADVWLDGDIGRIRAEAPVPQPHTVRAQFNGGVLGAGARAVFGKPRTYDAGGQAAIDYHLPVADALVSESANLLAHKPPTITLHEDDAANEQALTALADLTDNDEFAADWWGSCRERSAHGWDFWRVVWDQGIQLRPWVEWVDADRGMATFLHGRVESIVFWDEYRVESTVYRHLQEHTHGRIEHGLYRGSDNELGMRVPIDDIQQTAYLAGVLDAESGMDTYIGLPTAGIIRNLDRNHSWRHNPLLRYYGRSDVDKGGNIWASIDATWTDLQHERVSGRARIFIDEMLLETNGPGSGQYFDMMRDVFPKGASGNPDDVGMDTVQFDIRSQEYLEMLDAAHRKAVDAVGLSPITVGMDAQASGNMTATEIRSRSHKTISTHGGKARQARAGLSQAVTAYLLMDAELNNYAPITQPVNVALVEPVEDTPLDTAERIGRLHDRELASTEWAVRELHPEWTQEEVDAEVALIKGRRAEGMPVDPFAVPSDNPPLGMVIDEE